MANYQFVHKKSYSTVKCYILWDVAMCVVEKQPQSEGLSLNWLLKNILFNVIVINNC